MLITGPISGFSWPDDIDKVLAFSTIKLINLSALSTKTATLKAIHHYPLAPKAAAVKEFTTSFELASGIIIAWFFAPRFAYTLLPFALPLIYIYFPTFDDPTKLIALILESLII